MKPRVLIVLDTSTAWSRGLLRGFAEIAHGQGWELLHYHPGVDLDWLFESWSPAAAVLGPSLPGAWPARLRKCISVSVNADRSSLGIASVFPNEQHIAELALSHFVARGLPRVTSFRFDDSPFASLREKHFLSAARKANVHIEPCWWQEAAVPPRSEECPAAVIQWLTALEKPCGVFACCDAWARVVMRYAQTARIRVPEDIALVGVDNDPVECELMAPRLSSVAVPWRQVGERAAVLVAQGLRRGRIDAERVVVAPLHVVGRRSSDVFAVHDPLVAAAVDWIRSRADRRLDVPTIATAVGVTRQRLERHFRASLGRSVMQEVRRAHVELARDLLMTSEHSLPDVAKQSGFTNAALLSVAFRREVGVPPGTYRRRTRKLYSEDE